MKGPQWCAVGMTVVLVMIPVAWGQQPNSPHAGYVYPAGGRQGTTIKVLVGGQFLDGVTSVIVSGKGVQGKMVEFNKPLAGQALNDLREKLQALQKKAEDPSAREELRSIRQKIGDSVRRNAAPALSEQVTLEITLAPGAEPGPRQLRLNTALGLSNPLVFCVGQLPEFLEKAVKNSPADMELAVTLPATVNGRLIPGDIDRVKFPARLPPQYMPGDVDRYRFSARRGQHLVFAVSARDLMPYLADAVPGWVQATLTLYDAQGHEVAYEDDYRFHPDPVLHYEVPGDGEYILEIKDALYRGREDFVYRIAMGELPFVTSIYPLGGRAGKSVNVEVTGWNLPSNRITFNAKGKGAGIYTVSMAAQGLTSNRLPFAVDDLPEVMERETVRTPKEAPTVKLPVIVNGRIDQPGKRDVFSFKGRKGEEIAAEVSARRLESPLDSVLELTDAAGRRLAFNDDTEDKGAGLETHHADSFLMATLPANGKYFIRIGDLQRKAGPEYAYRLRLSAPRPDFDLRVSPSSINASGGATVPVTVTAIRRDGFAGDITLALRGAPAGFTLSGALVPAGQDQVRLTLTVPSAAAGSHLNVRVEGHAQIQGRTLVRQAIPADDMMQAFAYHHLVPADELRLTVALRGGTRASSRLLSSEPVKIPAGGKAQVRVAIPPGYHGYEKLRFELTDPPEGITLSGLSVTPAETQFVLEADTNKVNPGMRGNLIVAVSGERVAPANAPNAGARRRLPIGMLPAIAFEIVTR